MKNFSPGDVVVCVDAIGVMAELRQRGIYTVREAVNWIPNKPGVLLAEVDPAGVQPNGRPWPGFRSTRFRLAFKPDPEVERERIAEPAKRQRVKTTTGGLDRCGPKGREP